MFVLLFTVDRDPELQTPDITQPRGPLHPSVEIHRNFVPDVVTTLRRRDRSTTVRSFVSGLQRLRPKE